MVEAIKNALAVKRLNRAGIFVEMRVVDRGGVPQARFTIKHHGVTAYCTRKMALAHAKTIQRINDEREMRSLVWTD